MLGQHLGQAQHSDRHVMVLQPLFQHVAAVGAGSHQRAHAELVELVLLAAEHLEPQGVGAFVRAHATAPATAPVVDAGVFHLDEIAGDHLEQIARLLDHAAAPHQLAGIVEGELRVLHAFGLEFAGGAQLVQHLENVLDRERVRPPDQVRSLPAQCGIGVAALRADHGFHLELLGTLDDALHKLRGDIARSDLDAAVGRLERG